MRVIARWFSAPIISRRTRVCSGGSLNTRLVVWCSYSGVPTPNFGPNSRCLSELAAGAAVDQRHVVVARQQPLVRPDGMHRVVRAQLCIERIGIVDESGRRIGQREGGDVGSEHARSLSTDTCAAHGANAHEKGPRHGHGPCG